MTKRSSFCGRALALCLLLFFAAVLGCTAESSVKLAEIRLRPGCFPSESTYTISNAILTPNGVHIPFSGGLVLRSLSQGRDTLKALVYDTIPVGTPITRRYHVQSGPLWGFALRGPLLRIAVEPPHRPQPKDH